MLRPKLLISSCLEFDKVRYNGQVIPSEIIRDLIPYVDFIKVCPEHAIGLGVPRDPIRIVKKDGEYRLIQHKTERDVTDEMNTFSKKFIDNLSEVDGFIFKSKSPTMGVKGIKVYSGMKGSPVIEKCGGFFAGRIAKEYDGYPIEEEDRLRNKTIRDHFLTKLFLFASYRDATKKDKIKEFHSNNRLLFQFYNKELEKELDCYKKDYFDKIKEIMNKPPESEDIVNFFSDLIEENDILEKYRNNKVSFETLKYVAMNLLKNKEILSQSFFNPYPSELIQDFEKDRDRNFWK